MYQEKQSNINLHKLKIENEMQRNEIERLLRHLYDEQSTNNENRNNNDYRRTTDIQVETKMKRNPLCRILKLIYERLSRPEP